MRETEPDHGLIAGNHPEEMHQAQQPGGLQQAARCAGAFAIAQGESHEDRRQTEEQPPTQMLKGVGRRARTVGVDQLGKRGVIRTGKQASSSSIRATSSRS